MKKELIFLRTFASTTAIGVLFFAFSGFNGSGNQKFREIDVERINIVEKDGTVKMVLTNVDRFPHGTDTINNRPTNDDRKKRAGLLFFNEDGIECGGFIYDGKKTEKGHTAGLSLTYDQFDGDQVMQLLSTDYQEDGKRYVNSGLSFNDRPAKETQLRTSEIMAELKELRKKDPKEMRAKYEEYEKQGLVGGVMRVMVGKNRSEKNGMFLFDDKGKPRGMFYVDTDNNAKLEFYDEKGNTLASFPEKKQ